MRQSGNGLLRWMGRRVRGVRRVATGTGMVALALPLAWPSGAAGQHLDVPSASSVHASAVRLADWVTKGAAPAPVLPVQQKGSAAGVPHLVPASTTQGLTHVTGHAPGTGRGQLPAWTAQGPGGSPSGTFTSGGPKTGFDAATSALDQSGTTAKSDLYKNADGTYTRKVWTTPVNYKTASGTWAPIDPTLVPGTGGRWQQKANSLATTFAASGSDPALATLTVPGGTQQVSFSLAGAGNVAAAATGANVTYPGILPGTDVTETATADGLSESLTLASAAAGNSWTFPLTLKGLTPSLAGGSVDLTDSTGRVVAVIPPAVARSGPVNLADPQSQASSVLAYQLGTQDGLPALRMTLDPSWLSAPGRVFPVVVDPTVTLDAQGTDYTEQAGTTNETGNNSGAQFLPSGTATYSGTTYKDITFTDFSEVGSNFANDHVTSASLKLFDAYASQCTTAEPVSAYQVTSSWSPSTALTYGSPTYGTLDAQWTGTASADACNNSGVAGMGSWLTLPMNTAGISLLNQWTANSAPNYGFAVLTSLTDANAFKQFDSYTDNAVASNQGGDCIGDCRPYLQVNYTTTASDVAPQVSSQYPGNNASVSTLTPELITSATDADAYPFAAPQYKYFLYNAAGTLIDSTGYLAAGDWTVPAGDLAWGQSYYWTVQAYDGALTSPVSQKDYFTPAVPQPLVTSQLSQNPSGPGFNPQTGNWTSTDTDAQVPGVGPALAITRDYNSADPRLTGAFGAAWSSVLDMKVSPGENGSPGTAATQVVTYPDGEEVGFGLNPDGVSYSPPPGRFATFVPVSGGGFKLTDKNDTVYLFTQSLGSGVYGITSITDALSRTETFTYTTGHITTITSAAARTLTIAWTTPSGATAAHVSSVVTQPATAGSPATAQTWGYNYSGDKLSSACPPASTTACTTYAYTAGSDYPQAVLDSGPTSYWRVDDTSGTTGVSSVLANEGSDNALYSGVGLGTDSGPLAGSTAKSGSFDGNASVMVLPSKLVSGASSQTISMWFKTSSANGVLFSYDMSPITAGSTTSRYVPSIYVGADGKLQAQYWNGTAAPMTSTAAVTDGQWHLVTLSAAGSTQTLYLDGTQVGTLSGAVQVAGMTNNYVGTGFNGGNWPDQQFNGSSTAYPMFFHGDVSDVGFWNRQVTAGEAKALYSAGTHQAALLTQLTRPTGSIYAKVTYDPLTARATTDTDSNNGLWTLNPSTTKGSSQGWSASVLGAHPSHYYRLNDTGSATALDIAFGCPCTDQPATDYNVTENVTGGPFADQNVASFNGSTSYLDLPLVDTDQAATPATAQATVGLWFKGTGTSQVLYSQETGPVTGPAPSSYNPVLYIGADGKLNGELYDGNFTTAKSTAAVNDGKWHYAVLAAGASSQALYVDGTLQATISGSVAPMAWTRAAAGAGFGGGSWPDFASTTGANRPFSGSLAELAWYPYALTAAQVTGQWNTVQYASGLTPIQSSTVTDPGGKVLQYAYDLVNGGRELSDTNAEGGVTAYTYDTGGFPATVTDPDGFATTTGYDPRGNPVSETTCQDQANTQCSTSYKTYYPDDTSKTLTLADARNDMLLTDADGRSASSTDTTFQTKYAYNGLGELTGVTTPPVAGYPSGRTTTYLYTDGTTSTGGYNSAVPPAGLPWKVTTPGGAVTTTLYYANGDVGQVTDPDGQQTRYTYDGLGRTSTMTECSDAYPCGTGLVTSFTYDVNGNLSTETDPSTTDAVTSAVHTAKTTDTYDADGDILTQAIADVGGGGDATRTDTRTYNTLDQLASDTDPASGQTTYTYDAYGNKATQTDPDSNITQYAYDGDGNLLTTTLAGYTGEPKGSQAPVALPLESRAYDPAGRLAEVVDAVGRITLYYYTDNGLAAGEQDFAPDWSQKFTPQWNAYDGAGNLTEQWTNNGVTDTKYTVDAAGRTTQQVLDPAGLNRTTTVSYTPDDQQATVTATGTGGAAQTTSYGYDPEGNELSESVTDPGSGGPSAWYKLTQASGTAVADGISGGQPATASGVTWSGTAGTFTGASGSQVTTTGPLADTTGSFTVAGWVNLASTSTSQVLASQAAVTASGFTLGYDSASGKWQFARALTDTASPALAAAKSTAAAAAGTWTFLAGTFDANSGAMTLYVNGTAAGTATDTTPVAAHGAFTIGSAKAGGTQGSWLGGQAHDVELYPRALTAAQLSTLSSAGGDITNATLTTTWTRDQRGLPKTSTDSGGAVTTYTYDQAGQLTQTVSPSVTTETNNGAGGITTLSAVTTSYTGYNTFGELAETKDADGNVTTYNFDADGRQTRMNLPAYTPPGGATISPVDSTYYDGDGLVTSTKDALGNITSYGYDQLGNQVTATAPDTSVTKATYYPDGSPYQVTSPTGAVSQSTYDYLGRPLTSTDIERSTPGGPSSYTTSDTYNDATGGGWLSQQTSPDGVPVSYTYNPAGQQLTVTDGASDTTSYTYDGLGRQTKLTYPDSTATATGYDGASNPVSVQQLDASGTVLSAISAAYDGAGNQLSATDALGNSSTFTYNEGGNLTQELQPVSATSGITTSFGYDPAGNQTRYTDGKGSQWWTTYNSLGLQESRIEPYTTAYTTAANSTFTTGYDADGDPKTLTEPGGASVTDTYNNDSELTGQSGTGADAVTPTRTFGYDTNGNLTSATTSNTLGTGSNATSEAFTYDDRGLLLTASGTAGSTSYGYNGDGLVSSIADAAGTTSYTYDGADRLKTLADPATGTTGTYTYNSDSQVTGISYGSGKDTRAYGYNSLHQLTSDTLKTSGGTTVASVGYGYNADGMITAENTAGLAGATANTYTYDQAGRITSWGNGTTTTNYGYDANGNLTTNGAKTLSYDARDQLTSDGTNNFTYTARGTSSSEPGSGTPLAVTFDAYGDQATAGTRAYAYDGLGRLTSDTGSAGPQYAFSYAGSSGTIASDGASTYSWDPSGSQLAGIGVSGGTTSQGVLALGNQHGDVVGQFTAAGTAVAGSKAYDPWGAVTATSGTLSGQLGYQSGWADPAAGKTLMGARWYDPAAGDFTSADSVHVPAAPDSAAANPFGYVQDEPLDLTDPSGHCFLGIACGVQAKVVAKAKTVVKAVAKAVVKPVVKVVKKAASVAVAKTKAVVRTVKTVAVKVVDVVKTVAKKAVVAVKATAKRVVTAVKAVAKKVTKVVKTVAKKVATAVKTVAKKVVSAAKTVAKVVKTAAVATAKFTEKHAAAIGGAITGVVVFAGCEAVTSGAGSIGCAALSGAAASAVSYGINAAESGKFSWSGLGEATLTGAASGLAGGVFGEALGAAAGGFAGDAGSALADLSGDAGDVGSVGDGEAGAADDLTDEEPTSCPTPGGMSFSAGTLVLLASGKTVPISSLKVGDKVLAEDTRTGKDQPEAVSAVMVHHDTDLYDLTVKTSHGSEVIHTTADHLLWDPYLRQWVTAGKLAKGEHLKTPDGALAVADGGTTPKVHDGWMWDLTVPGNNDHDFYVIAETMSVLVHNDGGEGCPVTVYHYTDKSGWNGIKGSGNRISPGSSKNGAGPFVTTKSPEELTAPNAFKKLGITSAKSQYTVAFDVDQSLLVPLRGGRGSFIYSIPDGISIPGDSLRYSGPTSGWGG